MSISPADVKPVVVLLNATVCVVVAPPSVIVCKVEETSSHDTPAAELLRNFSVGPDGLVNERRDICQWSPPPPPAIAFL